MTFTPNTYTDSKNSVRAASTGNVNLSSPGATLDGVTLSTRNRILLKNQTTGSQNGLYQWNGAATPLTRLQEADQTGELSAGSAIYVEEGTVNGKKTFTLTTTGAIVIGTTSLLFEELTPTLANSFLNDLGDVDTTGVVDGALLRYEATGTQWNDTTQALLTDLGQLQLPTAGSNAGIMLGGDAQLYRISANTVRLLDNLEVGNQLRTVLTGTSGGIVMGGDAQLYRGAADVITVGTGDKIQQAAAPTVANDLTNKTYVDTSIANSTLDSHSDVDTTGVVDGSLLRYEATGTQWNDTTNLLVNDNGQLQVTTTGSNAGILIGGDTQLYRSAADFLSTPDNFQSQNRIWANVGSASQVEIGDSGGLASIKFGSTGDTNLYRPSADRLATDSFFEVLRNTNTTTAVGVKVDADAEHRFLVRADGKIAWGDGTAVGDVTLERASADILQTNDQFRSVRGLTTDNAFTVLVTGDTASRFTAHAGGRLGWGSGAAAQDVFLSRTAANIIAMDAGDKIQQPAAPTVNDDLVNKLYVDTAIAGFSTVLDGLTDVDTTGVVDGSLLRYEATGTQWNDTTALLFSDAGQLQVTTTGSAAGIVLGGDAQLYRGAANIVTVGTGDKIQQNAAPTVNDDLTNKLYVDTEIANNAPDLSVAFRRSWFEV